MATCILNIFFNDTEKVKQNFFSGDFLLLDQKNITEGDLFEIGSLILENKGEIFVDLRKQIEQFLGEGNFRYVSFGLGINKFVLSWTINISCFNDFLIKFRPFLDYYELGKEVRMIVVETT